MTSAIRTLALVAAGALVGVGIGYLLRGGGGSGMLDDPTPVVQAGDPTYGLGEDFGDLTVTDLDGTSRTLADLADGAPLVLLARDALCPVSRRYGPRSGRLSAEYGERGVRFLFLNVSPLDSDEDMRGEIERYDLVGTYAADHDWEVAGPLRMIATGEAFLFDDAGRLAYRGAIDDQYGIRFTKPEPRERHLRDALEEVLAGHGVTRASTAPEGCYLAADLHEIVRPHENHE